MNERFIELYEQASDIEREQEIAKPCYSDRVIMRFAEMIVKECAKELDDRTVFVRGVRAGTWIKNFMGIEE